MGRFPLQRRLPLRILRWSLPARPSAWLHGVLAFLLLSVCLTLIDKPHFGWDKESMDWCFMFSAFLGVPLAVPLIAGMAWSLARAKSGQGVVAADLFLLGLASFGLGCAASNIHDVVWCGAITQGFTHHHAAGYDLDLFAKFGRAFGAEDSTMKDYLALGPFAGLLVLGELLISWAAFSRLRKLPG